MNPFGHEIDCPDDRAIRRFLWPGYFFHDSEITDFFFDQRMRILVMPLRSVWECEDYVHNKLKGSWDERCAALDEHMDHFCYRLEFRGVAYFHAEIDTSGLSDVYCGRFLDSALVRRLSSEWERPLKHYRFESDGYIDIVFASFKIQKVEGRVSYRAADDDNYVACRPPLGMRSGMLSDSADERLNRFLQAQREGNISMILQLARQSLELVVGDEKTSFYAAWLLGFLGDASDVPALMALYLAIDAHMVEHSLPINGRLPKREVMEAIERIQWRNQPRDDIPKESLST